MVDLSEMLSNLSKSLPSVQLMLGGLSYILGLSFYISAMIRFKDRMDKKQSSDPESNLIVPLAYLITGSALLFLPSMMNALSVTLFGSGTSVLEYDGYVPYDIYGAVTILIETIGFIWFIRGWVLITQASHPEQEQTGSKGPLRKGVIFILAGLFGINFHSTVNMVNTAVSYLIALFEGAY